MDKLNLIKFDIVTNLVDRQLVIGLNELLKLVTIKKYSAIANARTLLL
jgi:hypothetical protein